MIHRMRLRITTIVTCVLIVGWAGSALAQRILSRDFDGVKRIAILPPRIDVFELTAGGQRQKVEEWSVQARENVLAALAQEFKVRSETPLESAVTREDALSDDLKIELEQTHLLLDAITASIARHILGLGENVFDNKANDFQYSLGAETQKLNLSQADAFLFVKGFDHISSAGRHVLQVASILAGAAGGAFSGVFIMPMGQAGLAGLAFTLVDAKTGDLLWYGVDGGAGGTDLRKSSSAASLVNSVFRKFPIGEPYVLNPPPARENYD